MPETTPPGPQPARPGSRFPTEVVADNVCTHRTRQGLAPNELAERMSSLGHDWTADTVNEVEERTRPLNVDELLGLALVLGVSLGDLLDPTVARNDAAHLDLGGPEPLWGGFARLWVRQQIRAELLWLDWHRDLFFFPGDDARLENTSAINAQWLRRPRQTGDS